MNNKIVITLFTLFIDLTIQIESKETPIVQTTKGPVQGEILNTAINSVPYSSFKGIPYAEPPLGYSRFKPPIHKKAWTEVLSTTKEGPNCVQKDFVYHNIYTGSEDCLYLNVYTPKLQFNDTASDLLTVMVWIYGGSFKSGYSNSSLYGPDYIIEDNVVLVTFNYRLGPLGFLNINHKNATGNAGLKDQNLVLRWVNENIEKFGGNPNNVTLFGQSAGGVAVDLHVLSDLSQGLFHQAIAQSSSPLCAWGFQTLEVAISNAFILGNKLGTTTSNTAKLLKTLYAASAIDIMEKTNEMSIADPPFKPTIESATIAPKEEKFLTQCPYAKYLSSNFSQVPYMTGFTSNETLLFAENAITFMDMLTFSMNVAKTFPTKFSNLVPNAKIAFENLANTTDSFPNLAFSKIIKETSDILFIAGIDYKRWLLQANSGHPVFLYRFGYQSNESLHEQLYDIDINGTAHGDDFGYLFHMTVVNQSTNPENPSFITRKRMVRLWTNFAKYGNPTPAGEQDTFLQGISWPTTDKDNSYLDFRENLSIKKNPASSLTLLVEAADVIVLPEQNGCISNLLV